MRLGLILSLRHATISVVSARPSPQTRNGTFLVIRTEGSTPLVLILPFGTSVVVGLLRSLSGRLRGRHKLRELRKNESEPKTRASVDVRSTDSSTDTSSGAANRS